MNNFPTVSDKDSPFANQAAGAVAWTVGVEATNAIIVTAQLKDPQRNNVAKRVPVRVWLSDAATGAGVCAVAPSGAVAISGGFGTILVSPTAKLVHDILSSAAGKIALTITESGAKTLYVVMQMPNGDLQISPAVTFA